MNVELCLAVAALTLQALALIVWITLRPRLERWVWMVVLLGFISLVAHRLSEIFSYKFVPKFNEGTAIFIALVALIAVLQTRSWIRKRFKQQAALAAVHDKLEQLAVDVQSRQPIATRIAEIINELRSQIDFYEDQARRHQLPTFLNSHK